jgi:hypothetical protein
MQPQPIAKPRDRRAWNPVKHNLTGQILLATDAEQAAYDSLCRGMRESLTPEGPLEDHLVQQIADDRWRLQRAAALESAIFADGQTLHAEEPASDNPELDAALAQGRTWLAESRNLALLSLYESRIQRRFERNMAELRQLQSARQAALQQAVEEAAQLTQLAQSQGRSFDLVEYCAAARFVFSAHDIERRVSRYLRLQEAKRFIASSHKPLRRAA